MLKNINSYVKIWNLGHAYLRELFLDDVIVQEKIDGSQFSFGMYNGELKVRSKSVEIMVGNEQSEGMFKQGIAFVQSIKDQLVDGWTYRGEYLQKPKHNVNAYDRIPTGHIILFDINTGQESYLNYDEVVEEGKRIGLETVPLLFQGKIEDPTQLLKLLERVSVLGGSKIEGFVIKNYKRFGIDGKVLMGKHVSEAFKEVHSKEWKVSNPRQNDIVALLAEKYTTAARWHKAVQHLKERGELTDTPKDIGPLMKEVNLDVRAECEAEIKQALFDWAWNSIARKLTNGLPEWYKQELMKKQFVQDTNEEVEKMQRRLVLDQLVAEAQELGFYDDKEKSNGSENG